MTRSGVVLAGLALLAMVACDDSPLSDPAYSEPMINGYLYRLEYYDGEVEYFREVQVFDNDGLRMVPVVRLNTETLPPYYYTYTQYRYGDERPFPVDTTYRLRVSHYWGVAEAEVEMPGNFAVHRPEDLSTLEEDSALVISWQASSRAQWYWLDIYADFEFYDTSSQWDDFSFNLDTIVFDTMLVIPPERIFPPQLELLIEGDGSALVSAGFGPAVEPGDTGNVRGAGFGFFNAGNEPKEKYFFVGAPPRARRCPSPSIARSAGCLHRRWPAQQR